ncbi:hypothetical protein NDU88_006806 [Pleurodeles waltl]|uniref:Uncharacterized protein n=1 Tax=Pleurodeles waltl TaxID=8319 RepID=A0AAV7LRV3_PLEWA|nr:hypothetical protein NDU88_006806 [Pleurodeles waltl]
MDRAQRQNPLPQQQQPRQHSLQRRHPPRTQHQPRHHLLPGLSKEHARTLHLPQLQLQLQQSPHTSQDQEQPPPLHTPQHPLSTQARHRSLGPARLHLPGCGLSNRNLVERLLSTQHRHSHPKRIQSRGPRPHQQNRRRLPNSFTSKSAPTPTPRSEEHSSIVPQYPRHLSAMPLPTWPVMTSKPPNATAENSSKYGYSIAL